ncbi:hypothetical protein LJC41_06750 [Desulfosarcina sp. OttesenSCG-928-G17]|nr:hypothetical protein [Desulfosarcina sp. OttesenSCG-928-G17]
MKKSIPSATQQINVVTIFDVDRAIRNSSPEHAYYLMDNSIGSNGQASPELSTCCVPGQTINWLIYAMESARRPDGSWPPMARFVNIVFTNKDGSVRGDIVCESLNIYGAPDRIRTQLDPVYWYWAGTLWEDLQEGEYFYRIVVECETETRNKRYFNLEGPSLQVIGPD